MPITDEMLGEWEGRVSFMKPGKVEVFVGPNTVRGWEGKVIPLDGRRYRCGGQVIFKNGTKLAAHLPIRTDTFKFLEVNGVYCRLKGAWYSMDEAELYETLGVAKEDALPFTWLPDRPLDTNDKGPYPVDPFKQAE